ncbi:hypothetical protein V9T40_007356 [Parthenolecanium corni]|uniref:Secreted protein n=1 Tax=Parthenolecanium corni TaxID=536013 RepID=A0AAN9U4X4_9HEMI
MLGKLFSYVAVFYFAIVLCHGISIPGPGINIRNRREISDECRPFPPPHRHHGHHNSEDGQKKVPPICCELPEILSLEDGSFDKCHERKPGSQNPNGAHKHGDKKNIKRSSEESQGENSKDGNGTPPPRPGLTPEKKETGDGLLNEDRLSQNKLLQIAANNTKWATTIDPVYKKCVAAGAECNEFKNKLEKCPNLWAPYPPLWKPHPHPPGERQGSHHN